MERLEGQPRFKSIIDDGCDGCDVISAVMAEYLGRVSKPDTGVWNNGQGPVQAHKLFGDLAGVGVGLHASGARVPEGVRQHRVGRVVGGKGRRVRTLDHEHHSRAVAVLDGLRQRLQVFGPRER